jgi:hypothetical protein
MDVCKNNYIYTTLNRQEKVVLKYVERKQRRRIVWGYSYNYAGEEWQALSFKSEDSLESELISCGLSIEAVILKTDSIEFLLEHKIDAKSVLSRMEKIDE